VVDEDVLGVRADVVAALDAEHRVAARDVDVVGRRELWVVDRRDSVLRDAPGDDVRTEGRVVVGDVSWLVRCRWCRRLAGGRRARTLRRLHGVRVTGRCVAAEAAADRCCTASGESTEDAAASVVHGNKLLLDAD